MSSSEDEKTAKMLFFHRKPMSLPFCQPTGAAERLGGIGSTTAVCSPHE
jgi:hypothetical protein